MVPRQALGAAPAPGHHQDLAGTLRESPHTTCAQQPANPICLPDKPLHILSRKDFRTTAKHTPLSIVPASCCHHTATWDGWKWGPTTEQIWDFLMDMQAVQDTQAKAGQEGTQGTTAGVSATSSHCVLIPPCQVPQPAWAVLNVAPSAFWGESLIFQGKLDTQGLTLITGSGH